MTEIPTLPPLPPPPKGGATHSRCLSSSSDPMVPPSSSANPKQLGFPQRSNSATSSATSSAATSSAEGGAVCSSRLPSSSSPMLPYPSSTNPNQLGFTQHPNSATNPATCSSPTRSAATGPAHQEEFQSAGGHHEIANPNLRFQPLNSTLGHFPKISSNFDKVDLQPQTQPLSTPSVASASVSQTPQTFDGVAAAQLGSQSSAPPQKGGHASPVLQRYDKPQAAQTFAEIAARKAVKPPDLFTHSLSAISPVKDTEGVMVIMPHSLYEQRLLLFQFALIGRIFLPPGSTPRSNEAYKAELSKSFQTSGDWNLLHLGKGYFSLQFRLHEDQLKAARHKSWRLSTGSIHLREWQPNFDPYKESSSTAQIWVRLFHLPTEYWHPEFLVGVFRSLGNVIKLDGNTAQGLVGHFARALVEIDLSKPLLDSVRVGLLDNLFLVDFSYENVPLLCSFCHYIGHSDDQCRKAKATPADGDEINKGKATAHSRKKKQWVEKDREQQQPNRIVPVGTVIEKISAEQEKMYTSNSFEALQNLGSGDESVPETQHDVGDIMDKVTGSSGAISKELTKELLTAARECSMNRQLRLERQGINDAAQNTTAAESAASESGEEMEKELPSSTHQNVNMTAVAPTDTLSKEVAGSEQEAAEPVDLRAAEMPRDSMTGEEGMNEKDTMPANNLMQDAAVQAVSAADMQRDLMPGGEGTTSSSLPSDTQLEKTSNKLVDPPPAKSTNRRTKNKRKVTETLPKRQLRSSTRNKSISKVTPEMIEAYARNQCYYVPGDSLGQPKDKQVAPNSPHPKQLEDQLRAAAALGRHTSAYILDTGQKDGLTSMDFIANQQWGDIPRSEAYMDSDFNSD